MRNDCTELWQMLLCYEPTLRGRRDDLRQQTMRSSAEVRELHAIDSALDATIELSLRGGESQ